MMLLLTERMVAAQPSLIRALGLTKAVVLQQVQWHLTDADHGEEYEGEMWCPITQAKLAAETGLSEDTIHRAVAALETLGYLLAVQPEGWSSRRKWYRINREHPALASPQNPEFPLPQNPEFGDRASAASTSTKPLEPVEPARATELTLVESGETTAREPYEDEFNRAWRDYPRKTARARAFRAYIATRRRGIPAEVLAQAVEAYAAARRGQPVEYTMHGSTFFGPDARFVDYVPGVLPEVVEPDRVDLDAIAARAAHGPKTGSRFSTRQPWEDE